MLRAKLSMLPVLALAGAFALLTGCASLHQDPTLKWSPEKLYSEAKDEMSAGAFDKAINVSGLVITKLDGSAKGGVLAAIACQCPKPVRYIGVGEQLEDLQPFSARAFAEALLGQ